MNYHQGVRRWQRARDFSAMSNMYPDDVPARYNGPRNDGLVLRSRTLNERKLPNRMDEGAVRTSGTANRPALNEELRFATMSFIGCS